jgi:poly-gamma-glutamate capsule biosynthesis protein CapA/YwtB (metallophosphatase superfamily)
MIKILFTADYCPIGYVEEMIRTRCFNDLYSNFFPILEGNDLNVTNLECPLYNANTPILKTGPALKASTETVSALTYGKFNLVTLANNHIMDHGVEGMQSTIEVLQKHGVSTVGVGMNSDDARKPFVTAIKGTTIAILNITENEFSTTSGGGPGANGLDPISNYYDIQEAKKKADRVFVVAHGGREMLLYPTPRVQQTYRFFVDAGADAVIGHHTHCYQGYEIYRKAPIFYSLGNFIFPPLSKQPPTWHIGFAVRFIIENERMSFEIVPYIQSDYRVGVRLLNEGEHLVFSKQLGKRNEIIANSSLLHEEYHNYCITQHKTYQSFMEPYANKYLLELFQRNLLPSLISKNRYALLLNLIRCETHRDILVHVIRELLQEVKL